MSDRRDLPRQYKVVNVLCRVGNDTFEATTRDLSAGGVFLETQYLFDPSQEIRMVLDLPGKGAVSATGRPMRVIAQRSRDSYNVGVAVKFVESHLDTV